MKYPSILFTPFPRPKNSRKNILWLFAIALSTSLFILIFKPFDIENRTGVWYFNLIIFGLGMIFFLSIYIMEFVVPRLLPKLFLKWSLGKAIVWYAWLILFVGAIMFLSKSYLAGFRDFTWIEYLFVLGRISVISITVSFFVIGIFNYFNRKNFSMMTSNEDYLITAPNTKPLSLNLNNLMYIVSDDNYVDIHMEVDGARKKLILRSSLKNIEEQIVNPLSPIFRCHRRHLINFEYFKVKNKTSRNMIIQLKTYEDEIPVSRQYVDPIVKLLQTHP